MTHAVLVTGGAGFIGSHTCKALAKAGFFPVAYDNLSNGSADNVRWGPLEIGEIGNEEKLVDVMRQYRPVAILHFAALIEAGLSVARPDRFYQTNVIDFWSVLLAAGAADISNIVLSSSAAVYGNAKSVPIAEHHQLAPVNPYGRSKQIAEALLMDLGAIEKFRFVILRYFNAAGADSDGELGECHSPETHLIPLALQAAYGQRSSIEVFGTDYETPDGTCIRDYVHVSDLARAHVKAVERVVSGGSNLIANIGTGHGYSVKEVLTTVAEVTQRDISIRFGARRAGDSAVLVADPALARRELSWEPEFPSLTDQVRHAAGWISQGLGLPAAALAKAGAAGQD